MHSCTGGGNDLTGSHLFLRRNKHYRDHTSNLCMLGLCLVVLGFFLCSLPQLSLLLGVALLHTCSTWTTPAAVSRSIKGGSATWFFVALVVNARGNVLSSWELSLWLFLPSAFSGDFLVSFGVWVTGLLPICLQPTSRLGLSYVFPSSTHQPKVLQQ